MTGQEAIAYIHSFQWEQHKPGLERIRTLLHALGDPQKKLKFVHVAGTNGKGSTCTMLASVLHEAGYKVGLNTSPYIHTFHERIRIDGEMISDEALARLTQQVRAAAETMEENPTEFEWITAIAMLHFYQQRCDIVVLEVGLGGELDASNVIDAPEAAVITAMGMDHVALLGPTLADVATAKAGIIKPGSTVVSYGSCPEADEVIRRTCRQQGVELREVDFSRLQELELTLDGAAFSFGKWSGLHIPLAGTYQPRNAATVLTTVEVLAERGWNIPEEAVREGLKKVSWPSRFEVLRREPLFLLDGAHNSHGMRAAVESLQALLPGQKVTAVLGILADKDVEEMLDLLCPVAEKAFVIRPDSPRALAPEILCELLKQRGVDGQVCETTEQAVMLAGAGTGPVCALGSLYTSDAVRQAAAKL